VPAAGNATAASQQSVAPNHTGSADRPSIIGSSSSKYSVGGDGSEAGRDNDQRRNNDGRQSFDGRGAEPEYNNRSAAPIPGYGMLNETKPRY
jgi:hypothetical protein